MGCDYYTEKCLIVKFKTGLNDLHITLERINCYFYFDYDSDNPDYESKYIKYVEEKLKSVINDIIIYDYDDFRNIKLEKKYKTLIEEELIQYNKYSETPKEWKDIHEIIKKEVKYERD
jgi:lipoate-protein ligase A